MSNRMIFLCLLIALVYATLIGYVVPSLISDKSDVGPLIGLAISIVALVLPLFYLNRSKKEKKDESN